MLVKECKAYSWGSRWLRSNNRLSLLCNLYAEDSNLFFQVQLHILFWVCNLGYLPGLYSK